MRSPLRLLRSPAVQCLCRTYATTTGSEGLALVEPARPPAKKRPLRLRPENQGLGGRLPRLPDPELAQKVFFPNFPFAIIRNSPAHAQDPFTATFRVPKQLTKADIASFLIQAYGVSITGVRTVIKQGEIKKQPKLTVRRQRAPKRAPSYKKAIVQLAEPFWFPEYPKSEGVETDDDWIDFTFDRQQQENDQKVKMKRVPRSEKPHYASVSFRQRLAPGSSSPLSRSTGAKRVRARADQARQREKVAARASQEAAKWAEARKAGEE